MYKYEIIIYWSNEDNVFIAEVPELPGCMAHGEAPEKALKTPKRRFNCGLTQQRNSEMKSPNQKVTS